MNLEDSELELHWAALRALAEPAPTERQRVLDAVRNAIELEGSGVSGGGLEAQPTPLHPSRSVPKPPAESARPALGSRLPWIGGALIGAALGLGLGLSLQRTDTPSTTTPPPALPATAILPSAATESVVTSTPLIAPTPDTSIQPTLPDSTTSALAPRARAPRTSNRHAARTGTERKLAPQRASNDDDFEQQLALLQRAESALHASNPELALGFLSDLDRRAPRNSLREERLTALALARCAVGQVEAARTAHRELLAEYPSSIYLQRLVESCARDAEPSADRIAK